MKIVRCGVICLAFLAAQFVSAFGPGVEAKTLEEILKAKGVITEEDYKEATKNNDLAYYKPGRGVTVESRDGKYLAQIGGRLQTLYAYEDVDSDSDGDDVSDFRVRRSRFWVRGHLIDPKLQYFLQGDFAASSFGNYLFDATISYAFMDALALTMGQFKPPQARQERTSTGSFLFVERSLANDTFNLGFDRGFAANGMFADYLIEYSVGIYNGQGFNTTTPDDNHMFAARIDFNPLGQFKNDEAAWPEEKPLLNIGFSYAMETMTEADSGKMNADNDVLDRALNIDTISAANFTAAFGDDLAWSIWTANVHFKWAAAAFGGEYYRMNAEPDTGSDWDADGYYLQCAYQVLPNTLELALRYSAIDSTDEAAYTKFDRSEIQFGVNYYLSKHNVKLQADFTRYSDDRADLDGNIYRLQAQVQF